MRCLPLKVPHWTNWQSALRRRPWGLWLLHLLSCGYRQLWRLRRFLYRLRILPSYKLRAKTVCVGNLTCGGTGKTTTVIALAREICARESKRSRRTPVSVVILTRGYGRSRGPGFFSKPLLVRPNGRDPILLQKPAEVGDEALLLARALPEAVVVVGSRRVRSGRWACRKFSRPLLILDDGFQHFSLRRDVDVVCLDATDPFGGEELLPMGRLREPLEGLARAQFAVLTHCDQVAGENLRAIRQRVLRHAPRIHWIETAHRPTRLFDLKQQRACPLSDLKGRPVVLFSGIGNPRSFEFLCERLSAKIQQRWRFPDHHRYTRRDLKGLEELSENLPLVTTAKDVCRLPLGWSEQISGKLYCLEVELKILRGEHHWKGLLELI